MASFDCIGGSSFDDYLSGLQYVSFSRMSGLNWAESSDEEDEYMAPVTKHVGLNDGTIPADQTGVAGFSSDEESSVHEIDESSESESEAEEEEKEDLQERKRREEALRLAKEEEERKKKEAKRPLSKKEKQALKAKELDDLDSLLDDFGVNTNEVKEPPKKRIFTSSDNSKRWRCRTIWWEEKEEEKTQEKERGFQYNS